MAIFNAALKIGYFMKKDPEKIGIILRKLAEVLNRSGGLPILKKEMDKRIAAGQSIDAIAEIKLPDRRKVRLWFEFKSRGQPSYVRSAALRIKDCIDRFGSKNDFPIVAAPGFSEAAIDVARELNVSAIDALGNCYIKVGPVLLDIYGNPPPKDERGFGNLFSLKRSRIIRVMLLNPLRPWLIEVMKEKAEVSQGLVSEVNGILAEWEIGRKTNKGFLLIEPEALLQRWAEAYSPKKGEIESFFSLGQPGTIEERLFSAAKKNKIRLALGGFSGAHRVAPAVRFNIVDCYVFGNESNLKKLADFSGFKRVETGPNINLHFCEDRFLYHLTEESDSCRVMDDIQLYLDLKNNPGRGEEAAEILLEKRIKPRWPT